MKTLGIIGGFSPEATAQFYTQVTREARIRGLPSLPHILVWSAPLRIRLEQEMLLHARGIRQVTPLLTEAARSLEISGADMIVLPCNTLHAAADSIRAQIHVPFLDIIELSVASLLRDHITRVGLLGTAATLKTNMFSRTTGAVTFIKPVLSTRHTLTRAIHQSVSRLDNKNLRHQLEQCLSQFARAGIRDVLMACTDFTGLCVSTRNMRIHDTLTILVRESLAAITDKSYFYTTSVGRRHVP